MHYSCNMYENGVFNFINKIFTLQIKLIKISSYNEEKKKIENQCFSLLHLIIMNNMYAMMLYQVLCLREMRYILCCSKHSTPLIYSIYKYVGDYYILFVCLSCILSTILLSDNVLYTQFIYNNNRYICIYLEMSTCIYIDFGYILKRTKQTTQHK